MKNIFEAPFVREMCDTTGKHVPFGPGTSATAATSAIFWTRRKSANTWTLTKFCASVPFMGVNEEDFDATTPLEGQDLHRDGGRGKYFKNVEKDPETQPRHRADRQGRERTSSCSGDSRTAADPASEFPAHMMSHMARLKVDPENRVVMHSHPTNTLAMNYVHELDEKKFTHSLWEMCTECIVVFPDGVGVLPWMLCGTSEIGKATAKKMEEFRLVIWAMHGIYGAGKTMDETFGLIETVEKAAQIYMLTANLPRKNTIKDEDMVKLVELFGVKYRKDFLNL